MSIGDPSGQRSVVASPSDPPDRPPRAEAEGWTDRSESETLGGPAGASPHLADSR